MTEQTEGIDWGERPALVASILGDWRIEVRQYRGDPHGGGGRYLAYLRRGGDRPVEIPGGGWRSVSEAKWGLYQMYGRPEWGLRYGR